MCTHHLKHAAVGGSHDGENFILLCPNCHAIVHNLFGKPRSIQKGPTEKVEFISALREIIAETPTFTLANRLNFGDSSLV